MTQTNQVAVRLSVEGAEQVKASLLALGKEGEAALKRLNFDTSNTSGVKFFSSALEEGKSALSGYAAELGPLGGILTSLSGGWLAAAGAAGIFLGVLSESTLAAEREEQSQIRVAAVLKATGAQSGVTAQQVEELTDKFAKTTNFTRGDIRDAAESLARFGGIGKDAFGSVLKIAIDTAATMNTDVRSAVQALGLAFEDPIANVGRLKRAIGVELTPAQKEFIETLQRGGNVEAAQSELLRDLQTHVADVAEEMHNGKNGVETLTAATHDATDAWDQFLVKLGQTDSFGGIVSGALGGIKRALHGLSSGDDTTFLGALGLQLFGFGPDTPGQHQNATPANPRAPGKRGPSNAELDAGVDRTIAALREQADSGANGSRARYIFDQLKAYAEKIELDPDGLQKRDPKAYAKLSTRFGADFDAQNATRTSKADTRTITHQMDDWEKWSATVTKDVGDQIKLFDELSKKQGAALSQMTAAQDAYLVDLTKGTAAEAGAVKKQNDDWLADQLRRIGDDEKSQIDALNAKADQYKRDGVAFSQYQELLDSIQTSHAAERAGVQAGFDTRKLAAERAQQGALSTLIAKGNADLNQSLKGVAADGLNSLEDGFLGVVEGTETVSQAFKKMVATILEEVAKLVLEKQVIGPLADLLNGAIDGSTSASKASGSGSFLSGFASVVTSLLGSANGNVFDGGQVTAFANGGVVTNKTIVPMSMMGEAGPEAIIPLRRGPDGKLGISGGGGGGEVHVHHSPQITIYGNASDDQIADMHRAMKKMQDDFATNVVRVVNNARSRNFIK